MSAPSTSKDQTSVNNFDLEVSFTPLCSSVEIESYRSRKTGLSVILAKTDR